MKKSNPFYNSTKRVKYFGMSLIKDAKDFCIENYKILLKEAEDTN
jgi:hypothetical protein